MNRPRPGRSDRQQELFEKLFSRIGELSSLPGAAVHIMNVASSRDADADDLLHIVEGDPALAVRVLRTVNSAIYSLRRRVNDLRTAITLLGFQEVRNLALTIYVSRVFTSAGNYRQYSREYLWNHCVAVASASRLIAEVCDSVPADVAYVAGLLHDLGLILEDQHLRRYLKMVLDRLDEERPTIEVEQEILEFDHCELGEFVARQWKLPEPVVAAAGYHHAPLDYEGPYHLAVYTVSVANYLCARSGVSSLGVMNLTAPPPEVYRELGLHAHRFERIVEQLADTIQFASTAAEV